MKERLLSILETRGIGNDQMDINLGLTVPTMDAAKKIIPKNDEMVMKKLFLRILRILETLGIGNDQMDINLGLTVPTMDAAKKIIPKNDEMKLKKHFFSNLKTRGIGCNQTGMCLFLTVHIFRIDATKPNMQKRVEMPMLLIGRRLEVFMNQMTINLVHQIWTDAAKETLRRIGKPAAIVGVTLRIVLEPDIASTNGHIFTIEQPKGASSYRLYANKDKSLVLGDADYRMQLLIKERENVETLRLKLNPFNLEADYFVQEKLIYLWINRLLLRCFCRVTDASSRNVRIPLIQVALDIGTSYSGFAYSETKNNLWENAKQDGINRIQRLYEITIRSLCLTSLHQDYQLQSLKQRMENVKTIILLYGSLDPGYQLQSLIEMMETVEKLILLWDSLDPDDYYRVRRLIGEMEHVVKQMCCLDIYHQDAIYRMLRMIKGMENVIIPKLWLTPFSQDAYYRMLRMIKGMENVIIPKLWLTPFSQGYTDFSDDWVIHVAKLHPSTTVQNIDEVHKHKEKTDDDYQFLQLKEALDLQLLQYCEKGKMKVIDGRIASETRALWNRFLSVVQIDKLKMKRLRTIYGKDGIKPEQLERPQPNAMRIKRSG